MFNSDFVDAIDIFLYPATQKWGVGIMLYPPNR